MLGVVTFGTGTGSGSEGTVTVGTVTVGDLTGRGSGTVIGGGREPSGPEPALATPASASGMELPSRTEATSAIRARTGQTSRDRRSRLKRAGGNDPASSWPPPPVHRGRNYDA